MPEMRAGLPASFEFSAETGRVDRELVHRWLSEEAYWSLGRSREVQDRAIEARGTMASNRSGSGEQVAYARVVTDGATYAWVCDVFVDDAVRGMGKGTALMAGLLADLEPLKLRRTVLATRDAHELYAKVRLRAPPQPRALDVDA